MPGKPVALLGDFHTCPQVNPGPVPHVGGPIDDDPHRAVFVVLGDVGQGAREVGIGHGGHGDQEVIGEVDGGRSHGRYFKPAGRRL